MPFYVLVGFSAQLIDGTLGMGYGVSASTLLLSRGLGPAAVSATVHAAEVFTTGLSGVSHHYFGNIDRRLFWRLVVPGVAGAIVGAYVLASLPGERFRPIIAAYLLAMGLFIIVRVFKTAPPVSVTTHLTPLGFFGAFIDAVGGGGWGPVVASTLIARGNHARLTVGSVNAAEFFVTLAASLTFIATIGLQHWRIVLGLALGGMAAAPLGAYACRKIPHRPFMFLVGLLVVGLSIRTFVKALH
ncbi:MAG: sulfite exporter TauE/SafE family protein [Candidatus Eisenbacteria bacterium]|nr:sulfite exporter TauE/SafE family protein [Candidatus Eisenbacteria bacterium]